MKTAKLCVSRFHRDHQWVSTGEKRMTGGTNFQAPRPQAAGAVPFAQPGMMPGQMVSHVRKSLQNSLNVWQ